MNSNRMLVGKASRDGIYKKELERIEALGKESMKGELPKTEEELALINTVHAIFYVESRRLGFSQVVISPEQVHFLKGEAFDQELPAHKGDGGVALTIRNSIVINTTVHKSKAEVLASLLHEWIHLASVIKIMAEGPDSLHDCKVGYHVSSPDDKSHYFLNFNEVVVTNTTYEFLLNVSKSGWLEKELGITDNDIHGPLYGYMNYSDLLSEIIEGVARYRGLKEAEVWTEIKKNQFLGNMGHLKYINDAFGKGSLRVLSALGRLDGREGKELNSLVKKYFKNPCQTEKDKILQQFIKAPSSLR